MENCTPNFRFSNCDFPQQCPLCASPVFKEGFAAQPNAGQLGNGNVDESLDPMDFVEIRPGLICGRRNIFVISCSSPCKVFCECFSFLYSLQPVHMEKFSDSEQQVFILSILSGNAFLDFDSE